MIDETNFRALLLRLGFVQDHHEVAAIWRKKFGFLIKTFKLPKPSSPQSPPKSKPFWLNICEQPSTAREPAFFDDWFF